MENPTLTFVTPALVVGDRSLTDTIAHEIGKQLLSVVDGEERCF